MLIASSPTTTALAPHAADRSWVVFLQASGPLASPQPIAILGMRGRSIGRDLAAIAAANPYDVLIVGLIPSASPDQDAKLIGDQYGGVHLHDGWYLPGPELLVYIQNFAQGELHRLLDQVHPGAISEHVVGIDEIAQMLQLSVPTIRRMVKDGRIPCLRWGHALRFVPADVLAAVRRSR